MASPAAIRIGNGSEKRATLRNFAIKHAGHTSSAAASPSSQGSITGRPGVVSGFGSG
jgi:hypothetical protein